MANQKSSRTLELIVARAVIDSEFRDRLLADKQSVVDEYQLTDNDVSAIRQIDAQKLDAARRVAEMVGVVHLKSEH